MTIPQILWRREKGEFEVVDVCSDFAQLPTSTAETDHAHYRNRRF
jgi:hypothetical protein